MRRDGEELVVLRSYTSDVEANIALGVLRTNGIECALNNEIMAGVFGIPVAPFDRIRLLVHRKDADVADGLLGPEIR